MLLLSVYQNVTISFRLMFAKLGLNNYILLVKMYVKSCCSPLEQRHNLSKTELQS